MYIRLGDYCEIQKGTPLTIINEYYQSIIIIQGEYELIGNKLSSSDIFNRNGTYILIAPNDIRIKHGKFYLTDFYISIEITRPDIINYKYLFYLLKYKNISNIKQLLELKLVRLTINNQLDYVDNLTNIELKINNLQLEKNQILNLVQEYLIL